MSFKGKMKNMKVKKKLSLYGGCMIVIMLIMGGVALWQGKTMDSEIREITEVWSPSMSVAQQMDMLTSEYRAKQYGHLVASTEAEMADFEKNLTEIDEEITKMRMDFQNKITLEEEKELYSEIEMKWDAYVEVSDKVLELSRAGKQAEGGEIMVGEALQLYTDFGNAFDSLVELESEQLDLAKDNVHKSYNSMIAVMLFAMVAGLIVALVLSKVVTGVIVEPVEQITKAAKQMAIGNLGAKEVITYEAKDEFGVVAESLRSAMGTLEEYVKEISNTLREMAKGDLTKDGKEITDFLGDFESIKESFVYILKHFNATLSDIQDTSAQVSASAGQITDSSQALSSGATEQAGAIEEVTSALSAVVKLSAESARDTQEAYENIKTSVENAETGRQKMQELTEEMKRIMEISQKIENISTTIEDIASQTNILSLNASVEAARAGEAGKGFAVVAEQIGKLASDSARSAVDTRELIGKALEEIKQGNEITAATSEAFTTMIKDMEDFAEIAHKTNENTKTEAESLGEVDKQIDMISAEIQNTAAASEENSAVSENLSTEAIHLDEMVKRFKLF